MVTLSHHADGTEEPADRTYSSCSSGFNSMRRSLAVFYSGSVSAADNSAAALSSMDLAQQVMVDSDGDDAATSHAVSAAASACSAMSAPSQDAPDVVSEGVWDACPASPTHSCSASTGSFGSGRSHHSSLAQRSDAAGSPLNSDSTQELDTQAVAMAPSAADDVDDDHACSSLDAHAAGSPPCSSPSKAPTPFTKAVSNIISAGPCPESLDNTWEMPEEGMSYRMPAAAASSAAALPPMPAAAARDSTPPRSAIMSSSAQHHKRHLSSPGGNSGRLAAPGAAISNTARGAMSAASGSPAAVFVTVSKSRSLGGDAPVSVWDTPPPKKVPSRIEIATEIVDGISIR